MLVTFLNISHIECHLITESTSERQTIEPDPFLRLVIGWFQVFCILIDLEKDQASFEQN